MFLTSRSHYGIILLMRIVRENVMTFYFIHLKRKLK
nr:MAG TPA: hypothetical protein [Caudoviricetes sp.]